VREFGSSPLSLAGSLLIAHPSLLDPNFRKGVLFISTNDSEEGSFGLTLNRPAGRTVSELLPDRDLGRLGKVPVFLGGPVGTDQLIFASFRWDAASQRMECQHHLVVSEVQDFVDDGSVSLRAFVGYAGWTKGQLEGELAQRAWLLRKPTPEVLEIGKSAALWREMTSSFGPWFKLVAESPEDPSRN
jgi:putative transcriptional regulator